MNLAAAVLLGVRPHLFTLAPALPSTDPSGSGLTFSPSIEAAALASPEPLALLTPPEATPLAAAPEGDASWPEADRLFRRDPRWLGGDAAYSVDLGGGRTLWIFGDSFIDPAGGGDRGRSAMVRNSIGIQEGSDPATARMSFHWGELGGAPHDFFSAPAGEWLWPAHGVRMGGRLLLFFMRIRPGGSGVFAFEPFGWTARIIENPDAPPEAWKGREAGSGEGALAGSAGVWVEGGWLYAMSPSDDALEMRLVRWEQGRAARGDLSSPQWLTDGGWSADGRPSPLFKPAPTEASVHRVGDGFVLVQTVPGGAVAMRKAPRLEGPWSEPEPVFTPAEAARSDAFAYAGKAHPHLGGAMTYAANAWEPARLFEDPELYYPRFIRPR